MTQINVPVVNAAYLNVQGLQLAVASNTTMTMAAGAARNSTNENDIILNAPVTINAAANGINGLDTGVLVLSALYAVYVVGDSSQNNPAGAVISANASAPLMPVGYDMYRLVGYVRTDASVHFLAGYWSGSSNERTFTYDAPITVGTTNASAAYADIDLSTLVPIVDNLLVSIAYNFAPNADGDSFEMHGANSTGDAVTVYAPTAAKHVGANTQVLAQIKAAKPQISYKTAAAIGSLALLVAGYKYTI